MSRARTVSIPERAWPLKGDKRHFFGNFACPGDCSTEDGKISKILCINVDLDETVCRVQEPYPY